MTKQEFFNQEGKRFFFTDPKVVAAYVKENCPAQVAEVIKAADDVAAQRFTFTLRWDMERTTEPVVFDGDIDWLHQPGNDPEWVFAFNRMRFWICLGQAYALTGNEKYAQAFVRQMCRWVQTVKRDDPTCEKAWRSIEAGLRLEYWLKAMRYFEASPFVTDQVVTLFVESIVEHAEYLMGIWNSFNLMSNWGVLGNHGLFLAGIMLPRSPRTAEYLREAIRRLDLEIQIQVFEDGCHWEQSPMYHNEVLHCYLDVVQLAGQCGVSLPNAILQKTKAMCMADLYAAKPNHHELCMGDSDDIDQRDIITRGAWLFGDAILKSGGYEKPDFDTAWEIGELGIQEYAALAAASPPQLDKMFADSGNFYFRSSWDTDATYLHFHCGPLGAGHGHADKLHFDLFSRGEDILVDAGRFTYVFGGGREQFKRQQAHNTVMVDGREIYVQKDSWECFDLTRGINQRFYADSRYGYAEGGHLAYINPEGVFANRRIIYLKPDIIVICDEFYTYGHHCYNQFFHWNNVGQLILNDHSCSYISSNAKAQMLCIAPGISANVQASKLSRHYNQMQDNQVVVTTFEGSGFTSSYTVIGLLNPDCTHTLQVAKRPVRSNFKGIVFLDKQIEALDIQFGKAHYTLVIAHEEYASPTDTFLVDGCTGIGSAVVFDRTKNETEIGTILLR